MSLSRVPRRGQDSMVKYAMMAVRVGALIAVVLGVGMLFSLFPVNLGMHMGAGLLMLGGVWLTAIRVVMGRLSGGMLAGAAALLGLVGVWAAMRSMGGQMPSLLHWTVMLATVGLAEAGAARAKRS